MNLENIIQRMQNQADAIVAIAQATENAQAHWKPNPESWSVVEVLGHLCDEERDDFRARTRGTLEAPLADWSPIHPSAWVIERKYNEQPLDAKISEFVAERAASITWLRSLREPNWGNAHVHKEFGTFTAADMLLAWLAHDMLHLRQLNELQYAWLRHQHPMARIDYAGDW